MPALKANDPLALSLNLHTSPIGLATRSKALRSCKSAKTNSMHARGRATMAEKEGDNDIRVLQFDTPKAMVVHSSSRPPSAQAAEKMVRMLIRLSRPRSTRSTLPFAAHSDAHLCQSSQLKKMLQDGELYHQRQFLEWCMIHTINNGFGMTMVTYEILVNVAEYLQKRHKDAGTWEVVVIELDGSTYYDKPQGNFHRTLRACHALRAWHRVRVCWLHCII